jgi:tripartite-type tricarboxylate transporter receptor subunit TctC
MLTLPASAEYLELLIKREGIGMTLFRFAAALTGCCAASAGAFGQGYPSKPIRFVSPQPPGGTFDYVMRVFGERVQTGLGQPLVIEHRAGAGLVVGLDYTARQPADGYTLLMSSSTHAITPSIVAKLPFDPVKAFEPVSLVAVAPFVLVVRADSPVKTIQDYVAMAKAKPGALTFGSSGVGTPMHFSGELIRSMTGIDILHVPYKGFAPVVQAILSGEVYSSFGPLTPLFPHIKSGKVRPIGMVGSTRSQSLPDIPTLSESGLAGFALDSWFGVMGPAGLPKPVVDRLNAEFNRAAQDPQFAKEKLASAGLDGVGTTPERLAEVLRADIAKYAKIVREAKIPPQ